MDKANEVTPGVEDGMMNSMIDNAQVGEPPQKKAKHDAQLTGCTTDFNDQETSVTRKWTGCNRSEGVGRDQTSVPPVEVCGLSGETFNILGCRTVGSIMVQIAMGRSRLANQIVIMDPISGRQMAVEEVPLPAVQFVIVNEEDAIVNFSSTMLNLRLHAKHGDRAACSQLVGVLNTLDERAPLAAESLLREAIAGRGDDWETTTKTLIFAGVPCGPALLKAAEMGFAEGVELLLSAKQTPLLNSDQASAIDSSASCQAHVPDKLLTAKAVIGRAQNKGNKALTKTPKEDESCSSMVEKLLAAGADPNFAILGGFTALTQAAFAGNATIVAQLLKAAANVDLAIDTNFTAMIVAASRGHINVMENLISARANVNHATRELSGGMYRLPYTAGVKSVIRPTIEYADSKGRTALMQAVSHGRAHVVDKLLAAGASIERANSEGHTALTLATQEGSTNGKRDLKYLISFVDSGATALTLASHRGRTNAVAKLLCARANVNHADHKGDTALTQASEFGYASIVDELLAGRANINHANHDGKTALICACCAGHAPVVSQLLTARANIDHTDHNGVTALNKASELGFTSIVEELLASRANIDHANHDGKTALMVACLDGHKGVVDKLLTAGANVNHADCIGNSALTVPSVAKLLAACVNIDHADRKGVTALTQASQFTSIVAKLLAARANIDHADHKGVSALTKASELGFTSIVNELLASRANIDHANHDGKTALMVACLDYHKGVVDKLLTAGANIEYWDSGGNTALISAVRSGRVKAVYQLLAAKANVNHVNRAGSTALAIASKKTSTSATMISKLVAAGAIDQPM